MDGVLLDTERLAVAGWVEASASYGLDVPYELALQTVGLDKWQSKALLTQRMGSDFPYDEVRDLRNSLTKRMILTDGVPVKPGARELIGLLRSRDIPCAVATSTQRLRAVDLLERSLMISEFQSVVCVEDVEKAKPAPDIFLEAASRLGVPPESCIVFEDSGPGLLAAHRAGMIPVLVPDIGVVADEVRRLAMVICESLTDAIPLVDDATRS